MKDKLLLLCERETEYDVDIIWANADFSTSMYIVSSDNQFEIYHMLCVLKYRPWEWKCFRSDSADFLRNYIRTQVEEKEEWRLQQENGGPGQGSWNTHLHNRLNFFLSALCINLSLSVSHSKLIDGWKTTFLLSSWFEIHEAIFIQSKLFVVRVSMRHYDDNDDDTQVNVQCTKKHI